MLTTRQSLILSAPFQTQGGALLTGAPAVYEEYGVPDGEVVVLAHGGLSSQHAAGRYQESDAAPGWWDGLVGPGQVFDTTRHRIISVNALGSMHGSCGPLSPQPGTGGRYGPNFPVITLVDQVHFLKAVLDQLGVTRIQCMAGPSMGSLHTLQMAAHYPEFVGSAIAVATAGQMTASGMGMHHFMTHALQMDPQFHGGWYDLRQPLLSMKLVFQVMKLYYAHERIFDDLCAKTVAPGPDAQAERSRRTREFLTAGMEASLPLYDPMSMIRLLEAVNSHDLGQGQASYAEGAARIQCPLLLINVDTDAEFPPRCAEELAATIHATRPGQVEVATIHSPWGHLACVKETGQLQTLIQAWQARP